MGLSTHNQLERVITRVNPGTVMATVKLQPTRHRPDDHRLDHKGSRPRTRTAHRVPSHPTNQVN